MLQRISKTELIQVQAALLVAIALQFVALKVSSELLPGSQFVIVVIELALAVLLGFTARVRHSRLHNLHHLMSVVLLALISLANISALIFVLHSLIVNHIPTGGEQLLVSAIAIFITNIIVYALWYWEIDSPGLTGRRWSKHDKDFQFTQQDLAAEFPGWQPQFGDYLFLAITNAVNFAPAETRPLSQQAKALMASQSLVSVFTLALVIARSVSILGS
ncbi:hypothetical protein COY17_01930 [Candidatus Saccharibacteria bacterium CG_4_10_14_0_2_um_filter_52_9]|nr:MAG: hypothetical protein COY17_01930 [Candidatus Saccharibacteria bacterium CG_4_10_14_0_2_um_filter_52_9]